MKRGRPRKFDPTIPAHIDQRKLPCGVYWRTTGRFWYVLKPEWKRLAGPQATLAELHALMEDMEAGASLRGSFAWLHQQFERSQAWGRLSAATQRDYSACYRVLERTRTTARASYAELQVNKITKVHLQLLIDAIGKTKPAQANHVRRYIGRLLAWGMARGKCTDRSNPARGLDAPVERARTGMPTSKAFAAVLNFAKTRGAITAHEQGSCAPYLWIFMVLAYRLRLRGIEVLTLTEANDVGKGIKTNRRKGSLDNVVRWSPELQEAWAAAIAYRNATWKRLRAPVPMQTEQRLLLVNETGGVIARGALSNAWSRMMRQAIKAGAIDAADRFTIHGIKHRGITDSKNPRDGGHATYAMVNRYNHNVPVVDQAGDSAQ